MQRVNIYNQFLPYHNSDTEVDADAVLRSIDSKLIDSLSPFNISALSSSIVDLHKYVILYGLRFSKTIHVRYIKILYDLLTKSSLDSLNLDKILKVLTVLLKKKYLLRYKEDLTLPWKPLFDLYYFWETSNAASRNLIPSVPGFKTSLLTLIKYARSYFPPESTKEMLQLWRPLLYPSDQCMNTAFTAFTLFLPTSSDIDPSESYALWFTEFNELWEAFGNSPGWEVELFHLLSRLSVHNVGRIDWEPYLESIFTKIMIAFNLPVTYGNSGLRVKYGLSNSSTSHGWISRWIVSVLGGGSKAQTYLNRMLLAIESYYYPANANSASESLHVFIYVLCSNFVHRVHVERHNSKWKTKIPANKRLSDEEITEFVVKLLPITKHILYSSFDEEKRLIINHLSILSPSLVIPHLLDRFYDSVNTVTEPHRFVACLNGLVACSRPLVENYPFEIIGILSHLLPGIDVNDIWKCTDIFILMSDILEMIWVIEYEGYEAQAPHGKEIIAQTSVFEDFVLSFVDKCLTLLEHSSREQTRHENDVTDEVLNEEEIATDAAIGDTFQKIMSKCSAPIFKLSFEKLKSYVQNRILEPTVAGGILAGMCKSTVSIHPKYTLQFFIPHLTERINRIVNNGARDMRKTDKELQFTLLLLSEVVNIKAIGVNVHRADYLLPHIPSLMETLNHTLELDQKDIYEIASNVLQNIIFNLVHIRILQDVPLSLESSIAYGGSYKWGLSENLEDLKVKWYLPTQVELDVVAELFDHYLLPPMERLTNYASGAYPMEKEKVLRDLRQIHKIAHGASEVLEPLVRTDSTTQNSSPFSNILSSLKPLNIKMRNGVGVRLSLYNCLHAVKTYLFSQSSDDTESLNTVVSLFDVLLFSFGLDEEELNEHMEEHRTIKRHRENKMIGGKKHLESVHLDRILIQHESFIWLKNQNDFLSLPSSFIDDIFELCTYRYSEVRSFAQELLQKIICRPSADSIQSLLLPKLIHCLSPSASLEEFKGALYIIVTEKFGFFYSWSDALTLMPALVKATHSDKDSIVELLKEISVKCNRTYSEYGLYYIPTREPFPSQDLFNLLGLEVQVVENEKENEDFLKLETILCQMITVKSLHWRHHQMAIGFLLGLINHTHVPSLSVVSLWLDCLIDDDRSIRLIGFQATEAILKVIKVKRQRVKVPLLNVEDKENLVKPGVREDNEWLQYKNFESEAALQNYWNQPFSVKPYLGYYYWPSQVTELRVVDESLPQSEEAQIILRAFSERFSNPDFVSTFLTLNSLEHKKEEDFFSMDKALFYSMLFECFSDSFLPLLCPHLERLVNSSEESHQRTAAEIVYGILCGSRFWSYERVKALWENILVGLLTKVLRSTLTPETIQDWETCFSAATNKADPNRQKWLYELLLEFCLESNGGAFQESCVLRLLNKTLVHNWKVRAIYGRSYEALKGNWNHSFNKVRHHVAKTLATLHTMDIRYGNSWNSGIGFPSKADFIAEVIPYLNLNIPNPEIRTEGTSEGNHVLEMTSLWLQSYIQATSASLNAEIYYLLPYLCQFIGVENDQDISQSCLKALCFLSVCIVPKPIIPTVLSMSAKIVKSDSYKAKISLLEFIQVFIFTNFLSLCMKNDIVSICEDFIVSLMSDENLQVRSKASKILCGFLHSHFLDSSSHVRLLAHFRNKIRSKMIRDKSSFKRSVAKDNLPDFHSGILGLCSFVEAYPYEVPSFVPGILIELETHLHDPVPVPKTIKKTLQEFKRTHQDNWQEHKLKFTEDQLLIMTDLLVSPNYYA